MDANKQIDFLKEQNKLLKDQCDIWEKLYRKDIKALEEKCAMLQDELNSMRGE